MLCRATKRTIPTNSSVSCTKLLKTKITKIQTARHQYGPATELNVETAACGDEQRYKHASQCSSNWLIPSSRTVTTTSEHVHFLFCSFSFVLLYCFSVPCSELCRHMSTVDCTLERHIASCHTSSVIVAAQRDDDVVKKSSAGRAESVKVATAIITSGS